MLDLLHRFNLGLILHLIDISLNWFVIFVIYLFPLIVTFLFIKSFKRFLLDY